MTKQITLILCLLITGTLSAQSLSPDNSVVQNMSLSNSHNLIIKAVKVAGLVETLDSKGPFTVFAPSDDAFKKLPKETLQTLLRPESKKELQTLLTYHVVKGKFNAKKVIDLIKKNKGKVKIETLSGDKLILSLEDGKVQIMDQNGNISIVTKADLNSSNGVIHVVDQVLKP